MQNNLMELPKHSFEQFESMIEGNFGSRKQSKTPVRKMASHYAQIREQAYRF